jgi:3-phosphoshikimate 1-carboxyvinyltransferase
VSAALPDRVRVHPSSLAGTVHVTGDKSLSHRCLLVAALAGGTVHVHGLAPSADVAATAEGLRQLGCEVTLRSAADGRREGTVSGVILGSHDAGPVTIDCGNSGTTLRMLAGLAAGAGRSVVLDGDASLRRRPVDRILAPLRAMGAVVRAREGRLPPLEIDGSILHGISWESDVASAQVKSAILLAALAAGVQAEVRSPHPSRDHTERMLRSAGIEVHVEIDGQDGPEMVRVGPVGDGGLGRIRGATLSASRDPSAAAFWHVAAACGAGTITTPGLCLNPGRTGALDVLRMMGADVEVSAESDVAGEPVADVLVRPARLTGAHVGGALVVRCLDELPVLAVAGALSRDGLEVIDASELRVKESDRISILARTLGAIGIAVDERPDGFRVAGGQRPGSGSVDAHGDHRIAMTAAVAATLGTGPVDIAGFTAVGTSYPSFLEDLAALGGHVEVLDA